MGTIFIERLNDWSIEWLMDYSIQNVIIHSFEWLNDWKIDRLWKFKYICFFFFGFERFNNWLIIYNYIFDWLKVWTIVGLHNFNTNVFFWMIERLKDWTIIELKYTKVFFEGLKMDYIISMMGIYIEGLNDWTIEWLYEF